MNAIWQEYNLRVNRTIQAVPEKWRINPNYISISRVFLVGFSLFSVPTANPWLALFAAAVFFTLTDFFDGACARAWDKTTIGGKLLDPVCDKISLLWFLLFLYAKAMIPEMLFCLVLFSELIIIIITVYWAYDCWDTILRAERFGDQGFHLFLILLDKKIPIQPAGKIKIVMFCISFVLTSLAGIIGSTNFVIIGVVFSVLGVIFTVISIPKYLNPPN